MHFGNNKLLYILLAIAAFVLGSKNSFRQKAVPQQTAPEAPVIGGIYAFRKQQTFVHSSSHCRLRFGRISV